MSLLENKKTILAVLMATSILALSGCAGSDAHQSTAVTPVSAKPIQENVSVNSAQEADTSVYNNNSEPKKSGVVSQNGCINQLDSLKTFSPSDYKAMVKSFKEISEINAMYRSVENTASKDSLDLLKMSIESKTEVLCAKVRYLSIMSVNSTLKKLGD